MIVSQRQFAKLFSRSIVTSSRGVTMPSSVSLLAFLVAVRGQPGGSSVGVTESAPGQEAVTSGGNPGGSCDPTAGHIRYGLVEYNASAFETCGPSTGSYNTSYAVSFAVGSSGDVDTMYGDAGPRTPISSRLSGASYDGILCEAGFQCLPKRDNCSEGVCESCEYGRYCPSGTSNRFASTDYNVCPAGYDCPDPAEEMEVCNAGHYCLSGSYDGGVACPNSSEGLEGVHAWGFRLYCPAGSSEISICPDGYICRSSATIEICPEGYYCLSGANDTVRYASPMRPSAPCFAPVHPILFAPRQVPDGLVWILDGGGALSSRFIRGT